MQPLQNIAILGGGAIGVAFAQLLSASQPQAQLTLLSRREPQPALTGVAWRNIDYQDEEALAAAAATAAAKTPLDLVVVATGILHEGDLRPEKSLAQLSAAKFQRLFLVNTITPALAAKHFLPHLNRRRQAIFAALSARIGSISDNRLGGWYAYRASKAALNMVIKTAAIEMARRNKQAIIVGLHPGTVDSKLSQPFQANVPQDMLFSPTYSVQGLLQVLSTLTPAHSGRCFAWDGEEVEP